jgi:hypothetical protein
MHETVKFYVTVRFALSEKLALKTHNVLIKKWGFSLILRYFLERLTVCYGTLKNRMFFPWVKDNVP